MHVATMHIATMHTVATNDRHDEALLLMSLSLQQFALLVLAHFLATLLDHAAQRPVSSVQLLHDTQ